MNNRTYSLIETPEQEAIARLLTNDPWPEFIEIGNYLGYEGNGTFEYHEKVPTGDRVDFPDLILQGLGADGVQAVRALAEMVGLRGVWNMEGREHGFNEISSLLKNFFDSVFENHQLVTWVGEHRLEVEFDALSEFNAFCELPSPYEER